MNRYDIDFILEFTGKASKFAGKSLDDVPAIRLDNVETSFRDGKSGISTEKHSHEWFLLEKGRALFKNQEKSYQSIYAWNEIICQQLCKQINLSCAEYEFAKYGYDEFGTISYDFLKPNEYLITGFQLFEMYGKEFCGNSHKNYKEVFDYLENNENDFELNKDEILFGLFKVLLFDYLTSQDDRHGGNIAFVCKKENNKTSIRLSPLFDNEMSFGMFNRTSTTEFCSLKDKHEVLQYSNLAEFFPYLRVQTHEEEAWEIVKLANSDKRYKNYLDFVMKTIDMQKCIANLCHQGIDVPYLQKNWYESMFFAKKEILENAIKRHEKNGQKQIENSEKINKKSQNNNDEMQL